MPIQTRFCYYDSWVPLRIQSHTSSRGESLQFAEHSSSLNLDYCDQINVDVYCYKDGQWGWYDVYDGSFTNLDWVEAPLPEDGTYPVTQARISFRYKGHLTAGCTADLHEFDFRKPETNTK